MTTIKVIEVKSGEAINALSEVLDALKKGLDPEEHKKFLDSPMLPGMTLTNGEVNALFAITESWDRVERFIVSVDWDKTIALIEKFALPENHPKELSDKLPPRDFLESRLAVARVFQTAKASIDALAKSCTCEACVAGREAAKKDA